jgi:release factor glutamine methyltransferase
MIMPVRKALSVSDMLKRATLELEGGSVINPQVETEMIISEKTGLSKTDLYLHAGRDLVSAEIEAIEETVRERLTGRPIQYILGHRQFRHLDILCREGVLIPRPETELLVDAVIDEFAGLDGDCVLDEAEYLDGDRTVDRPEVLDEYRSEYRTVVDIGCGTGAIGLSIAHEYTGAFVYMIDKSPQAISIATKNAMRNGLQNRIRIIESDMFDALGYLKGAVDIVVSNPPYIRRDDLAGLQREVRFEPQMALDGGIDGLDYYRAIAERAPAFLKSKGILLLEVGFDQSLPVMDLLEQTRLFTDIDSRKDYLGVERIVRARSI